MVQNPEFMGEDNYVQNKLGIMRACTFRLREYHITRMRSNFQLNYCCSEHRLNCKLHFKHRMMRLNNPQFQV